MARTTEQVFTALASNAHVVSADFFQWLPENLHVWFVFEDVVTNHIARGRKHFGAVAVVEEMRHYTAIKQIAAGVAGDEWKLNNNHTSYLARLYVMLYLTTPKGFFKFRKTKMRPAA